MRKLRALLLRMGGTLMRKQSDREFREEIDSHLAMQIEDNLEKGMDQENARRAALAKFGGIGSAEENYRERHGLQALSNFFTDLRFSHRQLLKSPGFTIVSILTLALGIGACTTMFALLNALWLRNLPVHQPDQLVELNVSSPNGETEGSLSFPLYEAIKARQTVFSGMFAWSGRANNIQVGGEEMLRDAWEVSGNFFQELGVSPTLGRFINDGDIRPDMRAPSKVAVLGYGFWQRYFSGSPDVIGKTILIEGLPFQIIGVSPKGYTALEILMEPAVTLPLNATIDDAGLDGELSTNLRWLSVGGRLKPGVSIEQARAEIEAMWPSVLQSTIPSGADANPDDDYLALSVTVKSAAKGEGNFLRTKYTRMLTILLALAGLVLLITCANLAGMLIARTASRAHETGIRLALGASRARLLQQFFAESLPVSICGAIAGLAMAYFSSIRLRDLIGQRFFSPPAMNVSPDINTIGFCAAAALAAIIAFTLTPFWYIRKLNPGKALRHGSRTIGGGGATGPLGRVLIGFQVALSISLLASAGLFAETAQKLRSINPGFRTADILDVSLYQTPGQYKNQKDGSYYPELIRRISNIPGVRSAALSHLLPFIDGATKLTVLSAVPSPGSSSSIAAYQMVSPEFMDTLGIQIVEGRDFTGNDNAASPRVAILSSQLARTLFPNRNAVGQYVRLEGARQADRVEVVGVAADVTMTNLRQPNSPQIYIPILQGYAKYAQLIVRTAGPPQSMTQAIRTEVSAMGHEFAYQVSTLDSELKFSLLGDSLTAVIAMFFAALSLILAAVGLYGLVSYSLKTRTREIGIRMALGAKPRTVVMMSLRESLRPVIVGVVIGIPCALLVGRLTSHMLFGVSPYDPLTLAAVCLALLGTTVVACLVPARRAVRMDPTIALRYE